MKSLFYASFFMLPLSIAGTLRERQTDLQQIPATAKAPNTFNKPDTEMELGQPDQTNIPLPDQYRAKDFDLPIGRVLKGNVMYFQPGEMNTPNGTTDEDGKVGEADSADQSACGIPDNVYRDSKIAIHPYWLKYAGLDRMLLLNCLNSIHSALNHGHLGMCLQDLCVGIFTMTDDMIAKVTDVCSIDPSDPAHCATPEDIKLPKKKIATIYHYHGAMEDHPELQGYSHPEPIYWNFAKCLGEVCLVFFCHNFY